MYRVSAKAEDWEVFLYETTLQTEALYPPLEDEETYYEFIKYCKYWVGELLGTSTGKVSLSTVVSDVGRKFMEDIVREQDLPVHFNFSSHYQ